MPPSPKMEKVPALAVGRLMLKERSWYLGWELLPKSMPISFINSSVE